MPGSLNVTVMVSVAPSLIGEVLGVMAMALGATSLTVMPAVPLAEPVSSSTTVTEMVSRSLLVPVGLSSTYRWVAVNEWVLAPLAAMATVFEVVSPQLMVAVNVSATPGSLNVTVTVAGEPSLTAVGLGVMPIALGGTLASVNV